MASKDILTKIQSKFVLVGLFSYLTEQKTLEIIKYNNKLKKALSISLYDYQREYLSIYFEDTNPLNYNIDHLYNLFKKDNKFNGNGDKNAFIKIITELFNIQEDNDKSNKSDYNNSSKYSCFRIIPAFFSKEKKDLYRIKDISQLDDLKDLTSIELYYPDNWNLKNISHNIKELKIEGGDVRIPLSVLDNLETLILEQEINIEIFDLNTNDDIYELENLKYLTLGEDVNVSKKLDNIFSVPNIIGLDITLNSYDINKKFIFYFDIFDFDNIEDQNADEKGSDMIDNLRRATPEEDISYFYDSYPFLKNLYLYFYDNSIPNTEKYKKFQAKEIKKDFLKINFSENDDDGSFNGLTEESFLVKFSPKYNREKGGKILRRKSKFIVNEDYNPIGDYFTLDKYEEIEIELYSKPITPILFFRKIKERNFSLQVITIRDYIEEQCSADYDCFISKNDIQNLCENIKQIFFLRKIEINLTYHNYEGIFDSKEMETLIVNLSKKLFLENIFISIDNSKLEASEKMLKLFPDMKTEKKDRDFTLLWEYN